ncbi:hypothetical protein EG347_11750 [Chryseobacterium sp. G0186]|uniref:hypothetical protein n=1 Tax=Chryseobacterium sp. G0186 TaxID=2487064 RepID=UPI000F4ED808|nr:hypothetical protein [Chryseobacterium sp. G0186]AZA78140.1 hypothetical protein EG347_11750 [Chryseobacterium sp. G0186]
MKKLLLIVTASALVTSCGSLNRSMTGTTESKLIKTVSVEQGCSIENVKVLDKIRTAGNATYSLDACGKRVVYKQIGTVFMESSKAEETVKKMGR